jgi:hypothetical protein
MRFTIITRTPSCAHIEQFWRPRGYRAAFRRSTLLTAIVPVGNRPQRSRVVQDHGWLDVGDAVDGDGLGAGEMVDGDGLGAGEVAGVGERLVRGV